MRACVRACVCVCEAAAKKQKCYTSCTIILRGHLQKVVIPNDLKSPGAGDHFTITVKRQQGRKPTCLKDMIQTNCGFRLPKTEEERANVPKTSVDIGRGFVVVDILKQARKPRFDETKFLCT